MPIKKTAKTASKPAAKAPKTTKSPAAKTAAKAPVAAGKKTAPAAKTPKAGKPARVGSPVTVIVRHDAGWGNHLHLRGEGPGLSWDDGAPMCCVHGDEWVWVAPASGPVTFKVLCNDLRWASGENVTVAAGETVTLRPVF